jgi:hypothetical protein
MRERKLRQIDRTITRLEKLIKSIPERLSKGELKALNDLYFLKRLLCCYNNIKELIGKKIEQE